MDSCGDTPKGWVAPFGHPRINACSRLPVAFRSVPRPSSPLSAKASTRCPSLRLITGIPTRGGTFVPPRNAAQNRRAQGQNPMPHSRRNCVAPDTATSHEDTSPDRHRPCGPEPIRLGHITNSLFTLQTTSRPGSSRDGISLVLLRTSDGHRCPAPSLAALLAQPLWRGRNVVATVVEVNGIEPMTSCLQSRRSPN